MKLKDLVAVTGMSGIYKMAGNRSNGMIVEDLETGKRRFASMRKHQFTPLESIAIYTNDDSVEIAKVFRNMLEQKEDNPPVKVSEKAEVVRDYFTDILPDYDRDRVHVSDMKKVIKWFNYLDKCGLLSLEEEVEVKDDKAGDEEE